MCDNSSILTQVNDTRKYLDQHFPFYFYIGEPITRAKTICLRATGLQSIAIRSVVSFFSEALGLLADELGIVEVVDAHGLADLIHRLGSNLTGLFRTFL